MRSKACQQTVDGPVVLVNDVFQELKISYGACQIKELRNLHSSL